MPIAGKLTDRLGPRAVLGAAIAIYGAGLAAAATAPSMLVLVIARFVQGIGGGGLYVVSLATVAKTYPERIRPRVMALLASMWIVPGLLGPPLGAVIASTIGWRWAFLAPLPLIVLATGMVMPSLRGVRVTEDESRLPVAASLVLMVGVGALLAGLTDLSVWSIPLVVVGLSVTIPSLRRITPPGTLTARPGVPAAAAAAFLASAAFFATDGFVTLMLTEVRGLTVGVAGIVLTAATFAWAIGSLVAIAGHRADRGASRDGVRCGADRDGKRGGRGGTARRAGRRPVRRVGDRRLGHGHRLAHDPGLRDERGRGGT